MSLLLVAILAVPRALEATDPFPEIGYKLSSTVLSESFTGDSAMNIRRSSSAGSQLNYTNEGLNITFNQNASSVSMTKPSLKANSVRLLADMSSLDANHSISIRANFVVSDDSQWYYGVKIFLTPNMVTLYPSVWLGEGMPPMQAMTFIYDVKMRGTIDIVVEVRDGDVIVGVDGFESILKNDFKTFTKLSFGGVTLTSDESSWPSPASIVLKHIDLGNGARVNYYDRLHKTITPWGHDFTLSMQVHADGANPAQLALLQHLANHYGVRGEFEAWVNTSEPEVSYSIMTHPGYDNALTALQESSWDIGTHAVTSGSTNRTELIRLIDLFEARYGPLKSWVDHGALPQDIWQEGNDPTSEYYISDVLVDKNVMIWVNEEEHSHSQVQDLNLDSVRYRNDAYPNLDLMKTSKYGFLADCVGWQTAFAPVTQDDLAERQRIYASNSDVIIWHEYASRFTYVELGGISYSFQSLPQMGYNYELIKSAADTNKYSNGTWHLIPAVEDYFAAMSENYNVWYATPREVYDRSIAIQQLNIEEGASTVTISNPTTSDIEGVTLHTKSRPWYCLQSDDNNYIAQRGAENWMFVIPEIKAGATIVLSKEDASSSGQAATGATARIVVGTDGALQNKAGVALCSSACLGQGGVEDDAVIAPPNIGTVGGSQVGAVPALESRPNPSSRPVL